ncbi:hypothetical protein ACFWY5_37145 [Nonomuraea sp. NPDC059007]|uniref:hypothetical protein n=1 Tax=Nonomuraea sp. NPDC059007 TaxID=3346692 RepID=UPI0036BA20F2
MSMWRDAAAQWMRMLTIMGDKSLSIDEQAQLIHEVNGSVQLNVKLRPYRWPWQRSIASEVMDACGTATLTAMNKHFITARLATEHLIHRLSAVTGESRAEILQELSLGIDATIAAVENATHGTES